jgi:hypothetical protein
VDLAAVPGEIPFHLAIEIPDRPAVIHLLLVVHDLVPAAGVGNLDHEASREPIEDFFVQPVMNTKKGDQDLFPHSFPHVITNPHFIRKPAVEFVIAVKLAVLDLLPVSFRVLEIAIEPHFPAEKPADLLSLAPDREGPGSLEETSR